MSKKYDLVILEAPADPQMYPAGTVIHQATTLIVPEQDGAEQIEAGTLPPGVYVLYEGSGKEDENGLPERFLRRDKWEVKPPPLLEPEIKKLT